MSKPGMRTLNECFTLVIKHWVEYAPHMVVSLEKANRELNNYLLQDRAKQKLIEKDEELKTNQRLKKMTTDEKIEFLKQKKLF